MRKRKKAKFRHTIIDNKKYYFYSIKWIDILSDGGHADTKEFLKKIKSIYGLLQVMTKMRQYSQIVIVFLLVVLFL